MCFEISGKVWIAYAMKRFFLAARPTSGGGDDDDVELDRKEADKHDAKQKRAFLVLATRWNAEIVSEKTGILVASLIAIMAFSSSAGLSVREVFAVAVIFYATEFVTDLLFVLIMDKIFDIPLLASEIHDKETLTKKILVSTCFQRYHGRTHLKHFCHHPRPSYKNAYNPRSHATLQVDSVYSDGVVHQDGQHGTYIYIEINRNAVIKKSRVFSH